MADFLTQRDGTWHFVRRVPAAYIALDSRTIVRHSTRIRVTEDRLGRRAARVADRLNAELEQHWRELAEGQSRFTLARYDEARRRARALGFEYLPHDQLITLPAERLLERLEILVTKGETTDPVSRAALLGTEKRPAFLLSRLFEEYEAATKDEIRDLSPDQYRIWRNGRMRAVEQFVRVAGDKPVTEIGDSDALDYMEWWRHRVVAEDIAAKTANKDIGQLSGMLKTMSVRRRLNLPDIFKGLRLKGETERSRAPFEPAYIQSRLLGGAVAALNEDARFVVYVMIETGLRLSEICNLTERTIFLNAPVPYVRVEAEGRRLKTESSARELPLVGVALAALRQRPGGFPVYRDKAAGLSATVNKFLTENKLRPTNEHTVYSLRHSFKDRLVAVEAPDSLIDALMGHATHKPKYGRGPSLELKLKFLERIAFRSPAQL